MTVLVTGATGNVGSAVVRELSARGEPVRAFARDPAAAAARLGNDVDLAVGDFADHDSVRRALDGVDRLFLSSGDGPPKVGHERAVIDAAADAGVQLIVKASASGADPASPLPGLAFNGRVEEHLRRSGVSAVNLRSAFYMTNLLNAAEQVRATGTLFAPAGSGAIAMIDPRDIGAVGAAVLTGDGHAGRCYTLTGPEAITYRDVARALTAATGRRVAYVDVPPQAAREGLAQAGMPDWLIEQLDGAFERIRRGAFAQTTDTVRVLTGREGRTFVDFASANAGLFAPVPAPAVGA
jgi:uncharacterized protein YbjT (DUF2867 family)